ncbi:hypothetical protein VZG47_09415 [Synechococcus elongatus IITB5]
MGWAAVTGELAWPAWILFGIVCLWTPPHFWALALMIRDDYAAVKVADVASCGWEFSHCSPNLRLLVAIAACVGVGLGRYRRLDLSTA